MNPIDRRSFLRTTAAVGLASLPSPRGSLAFAVDDDPLGVRKDFPVTQKQTYINSAYVGPMPRVVHEAAIKYADEQLLTPAVGLDTSMERKEQARVKFAGLFGAKLEEVALLFSTSDGENIVTRALDLKAGDNVVIDELHFITTFVLYRQLEKAKGIELRIVRHKDGRAPIEDFEARTDRRTRLISVAWVSNRNGYRYNLRTLADLAHSHGAVAQLEAALGFIGQVGLARVEQHSVALARELRDGVAKLGTRCSRPPTTPRRS